jgi:hypothetical protein
MIDLALSADTNDLTFDSRGDLALIAGVDVVAQLLKVGFRLFRGEWYLDTDAGMPYYTHVLVNAPKSRVIEALFRQEILSSPGIERISDFKMEIDRRTRKLSVSFETVSDQGVVAVSEVFP